jgi:hypothetical protein
MKAAKEWENKQCNDDNDCPTSFGRDIECGTCELLRLEGFRAGVKWVHEMFEENLKHNVPLHDVSEEIKKELIGD